MSLNCEEMEPMVSENDEEEAADEGEAEIRTTSLNCEVRKARKASICSKCKRTITVGELIAKKSGEWGHVKCPRDFDEGVVYSSWSW